MESLSINGAAEQLPYLITLGSIALCMLLETFIPLRQEASGLIRRWLNNFSLALLTWYIGTLVSVLLTVWVAARVDFNEWGILRLLGVELWLSFLVLLLAAQLLDYLVHRMFHAVPVLWKLHAIHHSDPEVDASTGFRHHPLEPLVSLPLYLVLILLLGPPIEAAIIYRLLLLAAAVFSHGNIRLAIPVDRLLRLVVITPDFHRLHHSSDVKYTNSNYGSLLPWFDYLFGTATARPQAEQVGMELGLEYWRSDRDNRIDRMVVLPLRAAEHSPAD